MTSLPVRHTARLIILNERNELFLFHHQDQVPADPANPILRRYWVTPGGGVDYERAVYQQSRWWSLAAIRQSPDIFYPEGLVDYLAPIIHGDIPTTPVALPSSP